jgi:hypothetical protein
MILEELIKEIELQRFLMGMGAVEFSAHLGLHYHTYQSFRKGRRKTIPKCMKILLDFAKSKGIDVNRLELR